MKVECGLSSTFVQIRITVGSGSDGSGNITGSIIGPTVVTDGVSYANQGSSTYNCYFSGDSGNFRMLMWQTSSLVETVFGIERSRDVSGNATTDYVTVLACSAFGSGNWLMQSFVPSNTNVTPAGTINTSNGAVSTAYYSATGKVASFPVIPLVGYPGNQMLGFVSATAADVNESNGTVATVSIYGANHSYLFTKQGSLVGIGKLNVDGVNGSIGMLYE